MSEELTILRPLKHYFPTLHEWVDTHRERTVLSLVGGIAACGVGAAVIIGNMVSTHGMLESMDPDYEAKCMSYNPEEELSAPDATDRSDHILNMMARFSDRGADQAELLEANGTIFCYGMENQEKPNKDYWPMRDVYFISEEYPDEMAALFFYEGANQAFWDAHVESPAKVRDYTPESSLLFSRFDRANRSVELIDNYATAIWQDGGSPSYSGSYDWELFLEENPELQNTVLAYTMALSDKASQSEAMTRAALSYMTEPAVITEGDINHLAAYKYHVAIVSTNSTEPIYTARGKGDWAFVDIDRDGQKDDGIQVTSRGQILDGNIVIDGIQTIRPELHRKTEAGMDIGMDADGNVTMTPTIEDVSLKVYYQQVPADETATVHLHPQTLIDMASMTGRFYLDSETADMIVTQPSEYFPSQLEYALPHNDQVASQLRLIETEIENNIPDHDTGEREHGPGLIN